LLTGIGGVLVVGSFVGAVLARTVRSERGRLGVANLNDRMRAWWVMVAMFATAAAAGPEAATLLFALISFHALREFITLTPTRRGDHRTLFWLFFAVIPIQYGLVYDHWYGLFIMFIPVWATLFVAVRSIGGSDTRDYLARVARIQWALLVCVYFVSHVPALLLLLSIPGFEGKNANLLFFLAAVVQLSDVFQYVWGKLCGKHLIAPLVSPHKTWEGFIGGGLTAIAIGGGLWWMTPFSPWQAVAMSTVIVISGFFGGLVMSAIKRDAGVKDWSNLIPGHGGIMDRIDSLCFAAPAFYHLTRYCFM
jgi:phosphatidate cytidylyltransferase